MGIDRDEYSKQPASKVSVNIRNEFNIDIKDIFAAWTDYNEMIIDGYAKFDAMRQLRKNHSDSVMNYFIAMSLELINAEIINGKK
jgi:hypothetical protein